MATNTETRETRQHNQGSARTNGETEQKRENTNRENTNRGRGTELTQERGEQQQQKQQQKQQQHQHSGQQDARGGTSVARWPNAQQTGLGAPGALGGGGSPFAMMRRMMDDMDRLFSDFGFGRELGVAPLASFDRLLAPRLEALQRSLPQGLWSPQVEMFERGDKLVVRADLPGLTKDDVELEIENDVLTIRGERKSEHEENRDGYYRTERSYGSFHRAIPLPEGTNADEANASFQNGVLEVTLPKPRQEQRRGRKIQIRS